MSAADTLARIARGGRAQGLLHTCRLTTDAGEAYGIEAVAAHFRAAPLTPLDTVGDGGTLAGIAADSILFADPYGRDIARIWRVGSAGPVAVEPRIDVAFDPDMAQARGDVFASPTDFPHIDTGTIDRIAATARAAIDSDRLGPPATRRRLFLLRVATANGRCAALFAHHALALGARTDAGFRFAALLLDGDDARWFADAAPAPRAWTPRV